MKQASVIALMATVATASGIHNHRMKHVHEKRDMVTKVETKIEPHVAFATVYVDQDGNRLGGKPATYGEPASEKKPAEKKPAEKFAQKPHDKKYGGGKKKVQAEDHDTPPAPKPAHQPAKQYQPPPPQAPAPQQKQQKTPEQIQQGYADKQQDAIAAQQSLIAQQQAKNAQQPGVGSHAQKQQQSPPQKPPQQYHAPAPAPKPKPKPNPPSYQPPSGGEGGMKQGQVTYYAAGLGSCGQTNGPSDHIVALSSSLMGSKQNCGRSLQIKGPGGTFTAKVQDTCPGCDETHLDLPENFYMQVTDGNKAAGHVPVSWKWTS